MLYHLADLLQPLWHPLNVVHYVSFRALAGLLSTLFFSLFIGNWFIALAKRYFRSKARKSAPERHKSKDNLPTMGGIFILAIVTINILLWCDLKQVSVWLILFILLGFGAIGAWDDWAKIKYHQGIRASVKFFLQLLVSGIVVWIWLNWGNAQTTLTFPFLKGLQPDIGFLFVPWALFVIVGASNGVNLTDGLDGLAIGSLLPNFALFSGLCYLAGNLVLANYLHIPFAGTAEIAVVGAILLGACLGFLWYNAYPAQIFMGDIGSLALGASLAFMALVCKHEFLLALSGGIFVVETLSVIIQLGSFRLRGKRVFRMAPMHHHFELMGWPEPKITVRFAIISLVLCLLALITIKIR